MNELPHVTWKPHGPVQQITGRISPKFLNS